jgi:hypothetical protein
MRKSLIRYRRSSPTSFTPAGNNQQSAALPGWLSQTQPGSGFTCILANDPSTQKPQLTVYIVYKNRTLIDSRPDNFQLLFSG